MFWIFVVYLLLVGVVCLFFLWEIVRKRDTSLEKLAKLEKARDAMRRF